MGGGGGGKKSEFWVEVPPKNREKGGGDSDENWAGVGGWTTGVGDSDTPCPPPRYHGSVESFNTLCDF